MSDATRAYGEPGSADSYGPILAALGRAGVRVETLEQVKALNVARWKAATDVLLEWLPRVDDVPMKQAIVRCVSVPWVRGAGTAMLIREFREFAPVVLRMENLWVGQKLVVVGQQTRVDGPIFHLAWALGNALSIVDVSGHEEELLELAGEPRFGAARQMIVFSLHRLKADPRSEATAIDLLGDEDVVRHAVTALGKMRSSRALPLLWSLVQHKRAVIRKEANRAIQKIHRQSPRETGS